MSIFDDVQEELMSTFSDWIQINDNKSVWTIEDFPYESGVSEIITKPHCWKCVSVNQCWFKNEKDKKPETFNYSNYSAEEIPQTKRGLYHPNCHCRELAIKTPKQRDIQLIVSQGKVDWAIKDKGHLLKEMGYREHEFNEALEIVKKLVRIEFVKGNYIVRNHDNMGFKIGFVLNDFCGRNEDEGKKYKIKSGWTIFPNGKLKCNTLIGGVKK